MDRAVIISLVDRGLTERGMADELGVSRSTVRHWLYRYGLASRGRTVKRDGHMNPSESGNCPWIPQSDEPAYAYILGLYLGDGTIQRAGRSLRLTVSLDSRYPGIQASCAKAMELITGHPAARRTRQGRDDISSYGIHWTCLLPHGRGRKHRRDVVLADWQQDLADRYSVDFVRGLIHSDGCRYLNKVGGRAYPTYSFSNRSMDIHGLSGPHIWP